MKISASQRKALEAAGYTVSKSGSTVQNKSGGTVGGYNENGKVFSGSKTVRDILKGTSETTKAAPKAAPKAAVRSVTSSPRPKTKPSTDGKPTVMSEAPNPPSYTKGPESVKITRGSGPTRTEQMRGNARTLAKARTLKGKIADAQKTLAANKQDMSLKEAKANTKKETKYPETTNPLILGARNIRNLFSGKGGLSDRKK